MPTTPHPTSPLRQVFAHELEIGDDLLNSDGSFDSSVYDVFTDDYGTWLETDDSIGYVNSNQRFYIEG